MNRKKILWKLGLGAAAVAGVVVKCGLLTPQPSLWLLTYFTILTNLMTGVYYLFEAGCLAFGKEKCARMKGAVVLCNLLTGCVYYLVLHPGTFRIWNALTINGLQHFTIPLWVVLDWLLMERKGIFRWWSPLMWSIVPIGYVLFIELGAWAGLRIGTVQIGYPYFFLNPNTVGVPGVIGYTIAIGVCWLLAGYVLVWLDRKLAERNKDVKA